MHRDHSILKWGKVQNKNQTFIFSVRAETLRTSSRVSFLASSYTTKRERDLVILNSWSWSLNTSTNVTESQQRRHGLSGYPPGLQETGERERGGGGGHVHYRHVKSTSPSNCRVSVTPTGEASQIRVCCDESTEHVTWASCSRPVGTVSSCSPRRPPAWRQRN